MKNSFNALIILLITINTFGQTDWTSIPSNTTNHLYDVTFTSAANGFTVGENGTILKTTDAGNTWNSVFSDISQSFKSIAFTSDNNGYALSSNSLFKTTNGGTTWELVFSINTESFNVVYFITENIGFIGTEYSILKTTDGGQQWISQATNHAIKSISFPSSTIGYFFGGSSADDNLFKTTDQGNSYLSFPLLTQSIKEKVWFVTDNIGYAVGWYSPLMKKTIDGGMTWTTINELAGGMEINFIDEMNGFLIDNSSLSKIYSTTDGGVNWTEELSISANNSLYGLARMTILDGTAYVVGSNGIIYKKSTSLANNEHIERTILNIYPNPTSTGEINISYDKSEIQIRSISMVNNIGSAIKTSASNLDKINVSMFSDGMYYLKFETDKGTITKKIVIGK